MSQSTESSKHLQLQKQFSELAQLAGGLAHEIRNPLSTIGLNLDLLVEDLGEASTPRDRRMLQKLQRVRHECERLEEILNAFLQFTRLGAIETAPVDLNRLVSEFIEFYRPLANERRIEISPHLASDLPILELDQNLWRNVLLNLSQNAVQAMPQGGVIEIQTIREANQVVLSIIDNGPGMDAKTRSQMFDAFFSTKPGGSGLGLPTVKRIVEAHKGQIDCQSEIGRGTRFTIQIPIPGR